MWVRNGRAFAPPWMVCRIGVSTSRNPSPSRVSRTARITADRVINRRRAAGLTARSRYRWRTRVSGSEMPRDACPATVATTWPSAARRSSACESSPLRDSTMSPSAPRWSPRSTTRRSAIHGRLADVVLAQQQLGIAAPVAQLDEDRPRRDHGRPAPGRRCWPSCPAGARRRPARPERRWVRVHCLGEQGLANVHPESDLLGHPPRSSACPATCSRGCSADRAARRASRWSSARTSVSRGSQEASAGR